MKTNRLPFTRSQEEALRSLERMATLYFAGTRFAGLRPRTQALLVGPSGAGKSHLVQALAERLQLPLLKLTVGDWIVRGARASEPGTIERVRSFVGSGQRAIIFLDELDKLRAHDNGWALAMVTEAYSLLDRKLGGGGSTAQPWTAAHLQTLAEKTFLLGAGTWMDEWPAPARVKRGIGFHPPGGAVPERASRAEVLRAIRESRVVPDELLRRFCADWLVIDPYTAEDFRRLGQAFGLPPGVLDPEEGERSGLNFRYVETCILRAALAAAAPTGPQLHLWEEGR